MRGRLLLAALAASLVAAGGVLAAPPEDRIVPADQHSSEKARSLAAKYLNALRELNAGIYHCVPWVEIGRESIGFFRPKHLPGDDRYLSLRIYVEQDPSPQFAALRFEERAASMFSRYVGGMLRRMAAHAAMLADPAVDGFTVIVGWLKQTAHAGAQPVHETIAVFLPRPVAADYLAGRAKIHDVAARGQVFGFDGATPLGQLRLQAWEDSFLSTYRMANYQPDPGVTCR